MSILKRMQEAAKGQLDGMGIRLTIGVVTGVNPLKVKVSQTLELQEDLLVFPEHLQEQVLQVKDFKTTASSGGDICSGSSLSEVTRTCIIQPKIKIDDRLILSIVGEEYVVIGKVGDPNVTITYTAE